MKRCVEFYKKLYRSKKVSTDQALHDVPTTTHIIDSPFTLPPEVETTIKTLKRQKAPKEDPR